MNGAFGRSMTLVSTDATVKARSSSRAASAPASSSSSSATSSLRRPERPVSASKSRPDASRLPSSATSVAGTPGPAGGRPARGTCLRGPSTSRIGTPCGRVRGRRRDASRRSGRGRPTCRARCGGTRRSTPRSRRGGRARAAPPVPRPASCRDRASCRSPRDGLARDLVEHHALHRHLRLEHLEQVPRDRLALAVLVGREVDLARVLQRRLELGDDVLLVVGDDVDGREVVVDVDPEASDLRVR